MYMRNVLPAEDFAGIEVVNSEGEDLGKVEKVMIDVKEGKVAYAVLSFGGFLGMGEKLFAIPWKALEISPSEEKFVLKIPRERLKGARGFDRSNWPDMADEQWSTEVDRYFGYEEDKEPANTES